jgi:hypothetical protein
VVAGELGIRRVVAPELLRAPLVLEEVKAANAGSSRPWWKISVVSMPPSVMKSPPSSCGSRSRYMGRPYQPES